MTASNTSRSTSENSIPRREDSELSPSNDPRSRRIAQFINDRNGSTTLREICIESGYRQATVRELLERMETAGYVQLLDDVDGLVALITLEGERLAEAR